MAEIKTVKHVRGGRTIGQYVSEILIGQDADMPVTTEQILEMVREEFPEARTTSKCVASYRHAVKKAGITVPRPGRGTGESLADFLRAKKAEIDAAAGK
jgi:hypothetical protein